VNDHAETGAILESNMDALTISAWVNFSTFSTTEGGHGIVAQMGYPGANCDFCFGVIGDGDSARFQFAATDDGTVPTNIVVSSPTRVDFPSLIGFSIDTDTWYHLAVVFDRATTSAIIYVDGHVVGENPSLPDVPIHGSTQPTWIGRHQAGHAGERRWLTGRIDDVAIWNRALGRFEIDSLAGN
jgi:hypothetical protein